MSQAVGILSFNVFIHRTVIFTDFSTLVKAVDQPAPPPPFFLTSCNLICDVMTSFKSFRVEDLKAKPSTKSYFSSSDTEIK